MYIYLVFSLMQLICKSNTWVSLHVYNNLLCCIEKSSFEIQFKAYFVKKKFF